MNDNKLILVNFRVSQEELEKIDSNAKDANLNRSAFIKLAALNSKVKVVAANKDD